VCRDGHYDTSACNDTKVGEACLVIFTAGSETDALCVVRQGEWDFHITTDECEDVHGIPYTLHLPKP
jgi:hypothetical protein